MIGAEDEYIAVNRSRNANAGGERRPRRTNDTAETPGRY